MIVAKFGRQGGNSMQERPVGPEVPGWRPAQMPGDMVLEGRFARVEPLRVERHAAQMYDHFAGTPELWTYMPWGPFSSSVAFRREIAKLVDVPGYAYYAICDPRSGKPLGKAAYMNIVPENGVIEVGGIAFSPVLQQSPIATEAMVLMMRWAFEAGYRRYEWKCNALNVPSRRAAQRLGFSYEGVFRQHMIVKGHNRDTAWFAVTDQEWPALNEAFTLWLDPANFDAEGLQKERLSNLTGLVRVASDPTL